MEVKKNISDNLMTVQSDHSLILKFFLFFIKPINEGPRFDPELSYRANNKDYA